MKKFQIDHPNASDSQLKLMVYEELNKILTLVKLEQSSTSSSISRLSAKLYANMDDCYGIEDYPFDEIALHNLDTQC